MFYRGFIYSRFFGGYGGLRVERGNIIKFGFRKIGLVEMTIDGREGIRRLVSRLT